MLTIFSTPKPFRGHSDIIQRNAIKSWTLLHPDVEVILFGDEDGAAEVAREFNIRNEREVRRSETGTKYLNFLFERAQRLASHNVLCYVNCDIMLMSSFGSAVQRSAALGRPFLMIGRRWDTDMTEPWDFTCPGWEQRLRLLVSEHGRRVHPWSIDYFVFSRELYSEMPPLVIGRNYWDNWLIWRAHDSGAAVIDASPAVTAVHQNHDYSYHARGAAGPMTDEQALRNKELAGNGRHMLPIYFATHRVTEAGLRRHWLHPFAPMRMALTPPFYRCWFAALRLTRPLRHLVGVDERRMTRAIAGVKKLTGHALQSRKRPRGGSSTLPNRA
jgi:hypothetical protein